MLMHCLREKTKILLFLLAFIFSGLPALAQSQPEDVLPKNEDIYVLDGKNHSFAWGRHIAPDKIAIGLSDEGVYEIRGNAIWLVEYPGVEDRQTVDIINDENTGNLLFAYYFPSSGLDEQLPRRIIGGYDPLQQVIFDKEENPLANITSEGKIVSPQGDVYVQVNVKTCDKVLSAFFFLYHYLPLNLPQR
jgi:hypothetical protein